MLTGILERPTWSIRTTQKGFSRPTSRYCTPEVLDRLLEEREKTLATIEQFRSAMVDQCIAILEYLDAFEEEQPFFSRKIEFSESELYSIRLQLLDIQRGARNIIQLATEQIDSGEHTFRVILNAYGLIAKFHNWIDLIVNANGLPKNLRRSEPVTPRKPEDMGLLERLWDWLRG